MTHGSEQAELGVAVTDSLAAERRLAGDDGFAAQSRWTSAVLGERIMGSALLILALAALFAAFMTDLAPALRLPVSTAPILVGLVWLMARRRSARKLEEMRDEQLSAHRRRVAGD